MYPELPRRAYESLKALCCLASSKKPLRAHEVAAQTSLPPAQTAKILQQLTWAGFVESRRGTKGGFWLLKPAASIRVTDVVSFFTRPTSERQLEDPVRQALTQATKQCRKELDHITVADLAEVSASKAAKSKGQNGTSGRQRVKEQQ